MKSDTSGSTENVIRFSKVKANWTVDSNRDTIKDLTLAVKQGELTTIIGQVGSGKVIPKFECLLYFDFFWDSPLAAYVGL